MRGRQWWSKKIVLSKLKKSNAMHCCTCKITLHWFSTNDSQLTKIGACMYLSDGAHATTISLRIWCFSFIFSCEYLLFLCKKPLQAKIASHFCFYCGASFHLRVSVSVIRCVFVSSIRVTLPKDYRPIINSTHVYCYWFVQSKAPIAVYCCYIRLDY